jgi:ABC-2 type transport system permease protein
MPEEQARHKKAPTDLVQIPIVWSYELLKYLRSWRIVASIAIVVAILALIYILPPALGSPYNGTDEDVTILVEDFSALNITMPGFPTPQSFGSINRSVIDLDSLQLFVNGTPYPSNDGANWIFLEIDFADELPSFMGGTPKLKALIFMENLTGTEVTATYDWTTSREDFDSLFLGFASILVIICATFFAADALVGEFQSRTGYLIFPNPLKREVLFLGKFGASMTAGTLVVVLFYAGLALLSYVTVGGVDDDFIASMLYAEEFLLAATAVGYLISSVLKGTTGATVLTFLLFMIILPIIDGVSSFAGVKIEASLTFAANVMTYIVMDPYPVDASIDAFGVTIYSYYPNPTSAAIVMLAYALVCMGISMFLFRRKQLTG